MYLKYSIKVSVWLDSVYSLSNLVCPLLLTGFLVYMLYGIAGAIWAFDFLPLDLRLCPKMIEFTVLAYCWYVGFVKLPPCRPLVWQKWFSTGSELNLDGITSPSGKSSRCVLQTSSNVYSIDLTSMRHWSEGSDFVAVGFDFCSDSHDLNQTNTLLRSCNLESSLSFMGRRSRNTAIIVLVCLRKSTALFRCDPSFKLFWKK